MIFLCNPFRVDESWNLLSVGGVRLCRTYPRLLSFSLSGCSKNHFAPPTRVTNPRLGTTLHTGKQVYPCHPFRLLYFSTFRLFFPLPHGRVSIGWCEFGWHASRLRGHVFFRIAPERRCEFSPAIYGWVIGIRRVLSPGGTAELFAWVFIRPYGTKTILGYSYPAINRWAIFMPSRRDGQPIPPNV